MRTAWFLNLDAEEELARPRGWCRGTTLWRAIEPARAAAAKHLVAPGDALVCPGTKLQGAWTGRAWCPTPDAIRTLRFAGAEPPSSPGAEVLRRVNDRRFLIELGLGPEGAQVIEAENDWHRMVATRRVEDLRVKRVLGAAGRGQRVLAADSNGAEFLAWARTGLSLGGVLVEPQLRLGHEVVTHGWISEEGEVLVGHSRVQEVDEAGAWRVTGRPVDGAEPFQTAARLVGSGLRGAGYFGPFGLDSLVSADGRMHLASDLNARYTMGWRDPRRPERRLPGPF